MDNTTRTIRHLLASAGCDGWCHAQVVGDPETGIGLRSTAPVVISSMYKVHLMVAACRSNEAGSLDFDRRIRIEPGRYAPGPTGFALFSDTVDVSLRDVVRSMITVSDNTSAGIVYELLPDGALEDTLSRLGLTEARIFPNPGERSVPASAKPGATAAEDAAYVIAAFATDDDGTEFDPAYYSQSTTAEMCTLLDLIWTDAAADPEQCAFMRRLLREQVWRHRVSSGFSPRRFEVAGKTGTIDRVRAESSVVTPSGERPVALSIVTRAARAEPELPEVDRAIGQIARVLVDALRQRHGRRA
ncbi:MAG TPA: class A beta-lactamase-related serine hydrolase [Dietzia timorensis]|uniref:Class A beta-lactamase-related serine hydrolase n=1 Tax=Dietzia timorensis TaxID=499555 RepID=A0A921F3E9_9ACTN|nr:serine hydrolase [Dietzia timorensis]HJE90540.1 class A beta-lactamase-related serine hydrolase [Dietzia timorensis]